MRYMVLTSSSSSSGPLVSPGYTILLKPSFLFLLLWGGEGFWGAGGTGEAKGGRREGKQASQDLTPGQQELV